MRYLLVDTLESNHLQMGKQPFSQEAKEHNTELLESEQITISFDLDERLNHYNRYLAYVFVDGVSV